MTTNTELPAAPVAPPLGVTRIASSSFTKPLASVEDELIEPVIVEVTVVLAAWAEVRLTVPPVILVPLLDQVSTALEVASAAPRVQPILVILPRNGARIAAGGGPPALVLTSNLVSTTLGGG